MSNSGMPISRLATGGAVLLGIAMLANGAVMLAQPQSWFWSVPGVPATGGYNQHFIRDIGLMYVLIGASFLIGTKLHAGCAALWSFAAAWLAGHALFHFWEVAVGICGSDAIPRDFMGVTLPAIVAVLLAARAWRTEARPV
jgi:disulfide bond formation protein DsbB